MAVQKTVMKVDISCTKCKKKILKAVSALQGVDKIETDEAKGTVTVTGSVDPCDLIVKTRKTGKHADIVSVGPPQKPEEKKKAEEKKPEQQKKTEQKPLTMIPHDPCSCYRCQRIVVVPMDRYDEPNPSCFIM